MEKITTPDGLFEQIVKLNPRNSVCQVFIPGKGKFTIVLQEEDSGTIASEAMLDENLRRMIHDSREAYKTGETMTTTELIKSISPKQYYK